MPIIPEKLASRQDVKSAIACQFWEQPSHSTRSIDGQVWSLPCEPPALNLTGSSGLSRTQQLIAAQALGVPAFPSYDASSQGLVLDRVLAKLGGKRWWTAVGARVKAQRMWGHGPGFKGKLGSVRDLDNYGVVGRGRFQLGRRLTLNGVVESPSVTLLHRRAARHVAAASAELARRLQPPAAPAAGDGQQEPALPASPSASTTSAAPPAAAAAAAAAFNGGSVGLEVAPGSPASVAASPRFGGAASPRGPASPRSPLTPGGSRARAAQRSTTGQGELFRGHASLRYSLPGHDLTATVGYHQDYVDCNGEYAHVPLAASLDFACQYRPDGLQYRVGLHQVTAPAIEGSTKAAAKRMRTTLHIQGAVAVEGEAHIWKPAAPSASPSNSAQQPAVAAAGGPAGAPAPASANPSAAHGSAAGAPAAAAAAAGGTPAAAEGAAAGKAEAPAAGAEAGAGPQQQQSQQQEGEGAPAGRVASALASAARADAGPDPATLPPRESRRERRRRRAEAAAQAASGEGAPQQGQAEQGGQRAPGEPAPGHHHHHHHRSHNHKHQHHHGSHHHHHSPEHTGGESGGAAGSRQHRGDGHSAESAPGSHASGAAAAAPSSRAGRAGEGEGAEPSSGRPAPLESFMRPLEELLHTVTRPSEGGSAGGSGSSATAGGQAGAGQQQREGAAPHKLPPQAEQLLNVSAQTIQAGIQESLALMKQVRESVARLTSEVQEGSLQRLSQQLADSSGRKEAPRRRPYSVFLSQPHLKLNGSMGCLARMPLPPLRGFAVPWPSGVPPDARPGASSASLTSLGSVGQAWEPYLKGTSLRLFASGGVSGQLGRFTRPFLDYTAVSLRADVGLTSPHVVGLLPDPATMDASDTHRPDKHRAFALEGRGSWHSLSASLAQQVIGPVRARADFRFALDPTNMPQNAGERSTLKGLAQTALSVRPSLLEAVFGFDVVLPGTEGAARLACWWSPHRREAMAELRLF